MQVSILNLSHVFWELISENFCQPFSLLFKCQCVWSSGTWSHAGLEISNHSVLAGQWAPGISWAQGYSQICATQHFLNSKNQTSPISPSLKHLIFPPIWDCRLCINTPNYILVFSAFYFSLSLYLLHFIRPRLPFKIRKKSYFNYEKVTPWGCYWHLPFILILLNWVLLCVCLCSCMWKRENNFGCLLQWLLYLIFQDKISHWTWGSLTNWLDLPDPRSWY